MAERSPLSVPLQKLEASDQKRLLRAGIWLWPRAEADVKAVGAAVGIRPPKADRGRTLLLTAVPPPASDAEPPATLWRFDVSTESLRGTTGFDPAALASWSLARHVLALATPVLLSTPRSERVHDQIRATHLVGVPYHWRPPLIDGASAGLSFVLALVSHVNRIAVPEDVAASAVLDDAREGKLAPVDAKGLEAKLRAVAEGAPRVRRVAIAKANEEAVAEHAAQLGLTVKGFDDAIDAVVWAFTGGDDHDAFAQMVVARRLQEHPAERIAAGLFRLGLYATRDDLARWRPIGRAAELVDELAPGLGEHEREMLQRVGEVACRHDDVPGPDLGLPGRAWLDALRRADWRARYLAQTTQRAALCGQPGPADVLALIQPWLPERFEDATDDDLHIFGARARLDAVTADDLHSALTLQRAIAGVWADTQDLAGIARNASFQLSEWFRLAGALGRAEDYAAAQAYLDEHAPIEGMHYVVFGKARGAALLGEYADALDLARGLRETTAAQRNPRLVLAATRTEIHALRGLLLSGDTAQREIDDAVGHFRALATRNAAARALLPTFEALVDLDAAVLAEVPGSDTEAPAALHALARLDASDLGFVSLLRARARRLGVPEAKHVHRFYPY